MVENGSRHQATTSNSQREVSAFVPGERLNLVWSIAMCACFTAIAMGCGGSAIEPPSPDMTFKSAAGRLPRGKGQPLTLRLRRDVYATFEKCGLQKSMFYSSSPMATNVVVAWIESSSLLFQCDKAAIEFLTSQQLVFRLKALNALAFPDDAGAACVAARDSVGTDIDRIVASLRSSLSSERLEVCRDSEALEADKARSDALLRGAEAIEAEMIRLKRQ